MDKRNQMMIGGGIAAVALLVIVAVVILHGRNSGATDGAGPGAPALNPNRGMPGAPGMRLGGGPMAGRPGAPAQFKRNGGSPGQPGVRPGLAGKPGFAQAGHPAAPGVGGGGMFGNTSGIPGGPAGRPTQAQVKQAMGNISQALGAMSAPGGPLSTLADNGPHIPHKTNFDPFRIEWRVLPQPPDVFGEVQPIRLAREEIEVPPSKPYEVREQPQLRVSGIMSGDGIYAILEGPGGRADIVRPGSEVEITTGQTKRTYRVVSIMEDSVKLESKEGNATYTQIVPMSDTLPGDDTGGGSGFVGGNGGIPGSGGFGTRPGQGYGGGRGK